AFQYRHNAPYAAFCRRRGVRPEAVDGWRDVPAVPTVAFKEIALVAGDPREAEAVFLTSGTTRGPERRGRHHVLDLSLYHASLLPNFAAHLLPEGEEMPLLSLVPPADQMAGSSLAHMIDVVIDRLGAEGSGWFAAVGSGIDVDALDGALRRFETDDRPVCLLGTALAFAHWLDALERRDLRYELPDGSRLMDTGGFKGRRREVPPERLRTRYRERLGVPPDRCVNEYGMTEMLSQFYDTVLRELVLGADTVGSTSGAAPAPSPARGAAPPTTSEAPGRSAAARSARQPRPRRKRAPPWVRTTVVDPDTLEPLPYGETGLLRHHDLANLFSVSAVQTADLGREVEDGFIVLGRATGAQPRGCSIAMDLLLEAVEREEEGRP
ncbi:MAG: hypothetical protein ACODAE_07185, partial [Gemmatimonadota bacterium]